MKRIGTYMVGAVVFLCLFLFCGFKIQNTNSELRIGLKNMELEKLQFILNGDYLVNGHEMKAGTKDIISKDNGQILLDGQDYDTITFTPETMDAAGSVSTKSDSTIRLEAGAKVYSYKGTIVFHPTDKGMLGINIVDLEDYIKGVVGYEMSNSYPLEALKAQAVAARSYALSLIGKHNAAGYDLCDSTDCQVYRGFNSAYSNVIQAVDSTMGQVVVYGDELVTGVFSASSGGYTEASGNVWGKTVPYLKAKKDDMENENWPYGDMTFTNAQLQSKLRSKGYLKSSDTFVNLDLNSILRDESSRVISIDIVYTDSQGSIKSKSIIKENARTFLSLPSALYTIVYDQTSGVYTFSGKGYGHGVGMSQVGAKNRAKAGQSYAEILGFYYDGTSIMDINSHLLIDQGQGNSEVNEGGAVTTSQGINLIPSSTTKPAIENIPSKPDKKQGQHSTTTAAGVAGAAIPLPNPNPSTNTSTSTQKNTKTSAGKGSVVIQAPTAAVTTAVDKDTASTGGNSIVKSPSNQVLKKGDNGIGVKRLQDDLKKLGYLNIKNTTEFFGTTTEKAVKNFQRSTQLNITGIADESTMLKIAESLKRLSAMK